MFYATLLVCAFTADAEITDNCLIIEDALGPYETEEQCFERTDKMELDALNNDLIVFYILDSLNFPPLIGNIWQCTKIYEDLSV
jgi:hypothetical protein